MPNVPCPGDLVFTTNLQTKTTHTHAIFIPHTCTDDMQSFLKSRTKISLIYRNCSGERVLYYYFQLGFCVQQPVSDVSEAALFISSCFLQALSKVCIIYRTQLFKASLA